MKKNIFLFLIATIFIGCSDVNEDLKTSLLDKSPILTEQDAKAADTTNYNFYLRSPQNSKTRTVYTSEVDTTVYGYTSQSSTGNGTYALSRNLKDLLGIPRNSFYICNFYTLKYSLTIDGLANRTTKFSIIDSPKCGLYPDYTDEEYDLCGYSYTQMGDNITLSTKVIHIISDQSGISYDIWHPRRPEELEWVFNLEREN